MDDEIHINELLKPPLVKLEGPFNDEELEVNIAFSLPVRQQKLENQIEAKMISHLNHQLNEERLL